jgi:RNA binding exosome subunit
MAKTINLDPILKHITRKLVEDRQRLSRILEARDPQGLRGFDEQERLLDHIQAAVRALDMLEGKAKIESEPAQTEESGEDAREAIGPVDMDKLAEALRPHGAAH